MKYLVSLRIPTYPALKAVPKEQLALVLVHPFMFYLSKTAGKDAALLPNIFSPIK